MQYFIDYRIIPLEIRWGAAGQFVLPFTRKPHTSARILGFGRERTEHKIFTYFHSLSGIYASLHLLMLLYMAPALISLSMLITPHASTGRRVSPGRFISLNTHWCYVMTVLLLMPPSHIYKAISCTFLTWERRDDQAGHIRHTYRVPGFSAICHGSLERYRECAVIVIIASCFQ